MEDGNCQTLVQVEIKKGMFQGDSLFPLVFVSCMILLSSLLRKIKTGYIANSVKINNFLFMDDLEMFLKSNKENKQCQKSKQLAKTMVLSLESKKVVC